MLDVRSDAIVALLRERRSIRLFRDEAVPRDVLNEVLSCALWAPSPHHAQPWRLTVLTTPAERERLALAMAGRLRSELELDGLADADVERQTSRSIDRITSAPAVVLCSLVAEGLRLSGDSRRDALEWQMAVQSVGALLQSVFLAAWNCGVGTCWMAAPMYCPDTVRDVLDLPAAYAPQALVLMGIPADRGRLRARRPFEDMVRYR